MIKRGLFIFTCILSIAVNGQNTITTNGLKIILNDQLVFTSIFGDKEYLPDDVSEVLLKVKSGNEIFLPSGSEWKGKEITISYPDDIAVSLLFCLEDEYIKFEITDVVGDDFIDALYFGPIPLTIDETVGEIVGVVRESGYAIGLQSLAAKTTGGKHINIDGSDPARGTTATTEAHGSSLQAYCINRTRDRVYNIWNNRVPNAYIPLNKDGSLIGNSIALFGCKEAYVLDVIEAIELKEGLPHSTVNGVWSKRSIDANRPYLITTFTEETIDECLEITERLGYQALYHSHPFANWGHFDLIEDQFPNGWDGMKKCVNKARDRGIRLGAHTLTSFITTNDLFVSPVPDEGLMTYCRTKIIRQLGTEDTEIFIADPEGYDKKDACQAIIIGNEIIRFSGVSEDEPYRLLNCKRGSYNTSTESYVESTDIARLVDHPYKVFFPDWEMQKKLIDNLAEFFNYTGVGQLDFDGHEGGWGTGEGEFGMDYFSELLQKKVRHELRNGSSRSNHFYWHTVSYINWGEPWYGGFTKSQGHYRYVNQALLKRNYIPNMLGWFLLNSSTTLQEFEYMLARSAGYDAGYALTGEIVNFLENEEFDWIVEAINIWEEARLRKIFNEAQLKELKDVNNDFSLQKIDDNNFSLQHYTKKKFELLNTPVQPGQPNDVKIEFDVMDEQKLYLVIGAVGESGSINSISFEVNGFEVYTVNTDLEPNWAITYRGGNEIFVYDEVGRLKHRLDFEAERITLLQGMNSIRVSAKFEGSGDVTLNGYVRLKDRVEDIYSE